MRNDRFSKSTRPLLSVEETAVLLGETRSTLYRALKAGTFPLPVSTSVAVSESLAGLSNDSLKGWILSGLRPPQLSA